MPKTEYAAGDVIGIPGPIGTLRDMCEEVGAKLRVAPEVIWSASPHGELWHVFDLWMNLCCPRADVRVVVDAEAGTTIPMWRRDAQD